MITVCIKNSHLCAFCKYWYDPTNEAIYPKNARANFWQYDEKAKKKCLIRNTEIKASGSCRKYECKLPIL